MRKADLIAVLEKEYGREYVEENAFEVEEAVYWLACDFHAGQSCGLYKILSQSEYRPGAQHDGPSTPESREFYHILKNTL